MEERNRAGDALPTAAGGAPAIPAGVSAVLAGLARGGYEAYLVGGCVRDLLRGAAPHDWDICTGATPEQILACFPHRRTVETGRRHGTITVLTETGGCEVTTFRREEGYSDGRHPDRVRFVSSLEEDLSRRDFTMNAIAMDTGGGVHDPFGGREDIRRQLVRCVGEPERRFREDGLRVLRALRFAAVLGFTVEADTAGAVRRCRTMLGRVSAPRVQAELARLLTGPAAGAVLGAYLDVLAVVCPPLAAADGDRAARTAALLPPELSVRLAALLRCCPGMDAMAAGAVLDGLAFDGRTRREVAALLTWADAEVTAEDAALRRWLNRLGREGVFRLLALRRGELLACGEVKAAEDVGAARRRAEELLCAGACCTLGQLAVNGRDAIAAGVPPGPAVGRALARLLDGVLDGALPNLREALLPALDALAREGRKR